MSSSTQPGQLLRPVRFGVIGTGMISKLFADDMVHAEGAVLAGVASRSLATAEQFAHDHGTVATRAYGSRDELIADPGIDVIYIGTPHPDHIGSAVAAMAAGKHVMCEKPMAMNLRETQAIVDAARRNNVVLMEALWTLFLPHYCDVRQLIESGAIGDVVAVQADFGFRMPWTPEHRLLDLGLGGGSWLDQGIYPLLLATTVLGPGEIRLSTGHRGTTGVDERCTAVLQHHGGAMSILRCATRAEIGTTATINGTGGLIHIDGPWWGPAKVTICRNGQAEECREYEVAGKGYHYETAEMVQLVRSGARESQVATHGLSLELARNLEALRTSLGVTYDADSRIDAS
jgi:predicted dehydrogenase